MTVDSLGLSLDGHDTVTFWASRTDETACLVFKTDGSYCEIVMARENVEALRDQLPEVLADLDRLDELANEVEADHCTPEHRQALYGVASV